MAANLADVAAAYKGPPGSRHLGKSPSRFSFETGLAALRRRWPGTDDDAGDAPVFILAAGWRSGSTLLQRMVLANRRTLVWGEPYAHSDMAGSLSRQIHAFSAAWPEDEWVAGGTGPDLSAQWTANLYPPAVDLVRAHRAFWLTLLGEPAARDGWKNWGLKETRWGVTEARYLKWLFPRSRFVFLYRNPYEAYGSYRRWRDWYRHWPDRPVVTPRQFGRMWRKMVENFRDGYRSVDGFLVAYEALSDDGTVGQLGAHLGETLPSPHMLARLRGHDERDAAAASALEMARLEAAVHPVAAELGFAPPVSSWSSRARKRRNSRSASSSPRADARA